MYTTTRKTGVNIYRKWMNFYFFISCKYYIIIKLHLVQAETDTPSEKHRIFYGNRE